MYLTATYIGVTHIRRIPMYSTMICAGKDFDGGALGRGLLFMINFPRGSNFPTENTSAQLIPTTQNTSVLESCPEFRAHRFHPRSK